MTLFSSVLHYIEITTVLISMLVADFAVIMMAVSFVPTILTGPFALAWQYKPDFGEKRLPRLQLVSAILEMGQIAILFVLLLTDSRYLYPDLIIPWNSPAMLAICLLMCVLWAADARSSNPVARGKARASIMFAIPLGIIVLIAPFFSLFQDPGLTWWALIAAACLTFISSALGMSTFFRTTRSFLDLASRHDELGRQLNQLQQLANILPDNRESVGLQEALQNARDSRQNALNAFHQNKMQGAEEYILRAESEVDGASRMIHDRMHLSLKDELKAKIAQSRNDCAALRAEFEVAGLSGSDLQNLETRLAELSDRLGGIEFDAGDLQEKLDPFERLFGDIVATRTALRFRTNVDASLDKLRTEIRETAPQLAIAKALGLSGGSLGKSSEALAGLMDKFTQSRNFSAEELVEHYKSLREGAIDHRAAKRVLETELGRQFFIEESQVLDARIYVPRSITTMRASTGLIFVDHQRGNKVVQCELDGVLLDFQQVRTVVVDQKDNSPFTVNTFDVVGKRGGIGKLKLLMSRPSPPANTSYAFDLVIVTSGFETAKDAFVVVTPSSGVAAVAAWAIWKDPAIASPLGATLGGALGLLIFFFLRLNARKRIGVRVQ